MSKRPDIATVLEPDETLLWQGAPKPGRPTPLRASLISTGLYMATVVLSLIAWDLEVFHLVGPQIHLIAYGLVGTAAFTTFLGLRISVLDRRRARARDAATAYAITTRRAIALAGPYKTDLVFGRGFRTDLSGSTLTLIAPTGELRFERLTDAKAARDIVLEQIGKVQ